MNEKIGAGIIKKKTVGNERYGCQSNKFKWCKRYIRV